MFSLKYYAEITDFLKLAKSQMLFSILPHLQISPPQLFLIDSLLTNIIFFHIDEAGKVLQIPYDI